MHLKQIKLSGFKSFVDTTVLPFKEHIAAIVGPNGCGKSNIIDAVRWVLGESSAKHLRGDSLSDVIFNGSAERKPVGQAMVELTFDNTQGQLGGAYAAYSELMIRRVVDRENQSFYFLNGKRCRRRDITDLFLGTGLSPRSYAIIEQGMIVRLVAAKPEELRYYLEEAAGVAKYKERRRETEARLENTRLNLARLRDVRIELDRQVEQLAQQAETAKRYQSLRQEQRQTQRALLAMRWQELQQSLQQQARRIQQAEVCLSQQEADYQEAKQLAYHLQQQQQQHNENLRQKQQHYYQSAQELQRLAQLGEQQRDQQKRLQDKLAELQQHCAAAEAAIIQEQEAQQALHAEWEHLTEQLMAAEVKGQQARSQAEESEQAYLHQQSHWEKQWQAAQQAQQQLHQLQHEQQWVQCQQEVLAKEAAAVSERQRILEQTLVSSAELKELNAVEQQLLAEKEQYLSAFKESEQRLQTQKHRQREQQNAINQQQVRLQQNEKAYLQVSATYQSALQRNLSNQVPDFLQDMPQLATELTVEPGWEAAVEWVLGEWLGSYGCSAWVMLQEQALALKPAQFSVVNLETDWPKPSQELSTLWHKVDTTWPIQPILATIYIAANRAEAFQLVTQLHSHESVITQDGLWVSQYAARFFMCLDTEQSVLRLQQQLARLEQERTLQQTILADLITQQQAIEQSIAGILAEHERYKLRLQEITHALIKQQAEIRLKQRQYEQEQNQIADYQRKQQRIQEQLAELAERAQAISVQRKQMEETCQVAEQKAQHIKQTQQQLKERWQCQREHYQQLQTEAGKLRTLVATKKEQLGYVARQCQQQQQLCQQLQQQLHQLIPQLTQLETALQQTRSQYEAQAQLVQERQQDLTSTQQLVQQIQQQWNAQLAQLTAKEQAVREAQQQLEQQKLTWQTLHTRQEDLAEECRQNELTLDNIDKYRMPHCSEKELKRRLEQLTRSIKQLGAVNLMAIDEYAKQFERQQYLSKQQQDLEAAIAQLTAAITTIDEESQQRLQRTFIQVNQAFAELFPKLFGGGEASLALTHDDWLSAGIRVIARPPGKRNNTIQLLSGGEKTLTAIALMFAFFKLNPAPFCILDEVDAPLDDANVERFCQLIKEMAVAVQFVIITHNKVTMATADQLIGVTMREPGVSKLVTVSLAEAVELSE